MKSRLATLLILLGLLTATPALALDLHSARSTGLVGEKADGYAQALKATPEVQALVADVNAKRQQEYARISKENGQPTSVVAKLAAQQIITNLGAGASYQTPSGEWKKK
ncbi:MAG: YdbL family protein [Bdellovibrionales bacterium]|jgi:hypothetical protein